LRIFWLGIYAHLHKICSSAAYMCIFGLAYMHTCIFYAHAKSAVELHICDMHNVASLFMMFP